MLPGFSTKTADAMTPAIESASHLLEIVQQVLSSQNNTQITLTGIGNITILPLSREYHADLNDMCKFSTAPAENFAKKTLDSSELANISSSGKDIRDLLWQLAFYIYEDRLIENCSENDVIQFKRWPNLTRLPTTPNTARICALLTRHPTSVTLIRRVLGIDRKEVNRVVSAAFSAGIVNTVSRGPTLISAETVTTEVKPEQTQISGLWNSLFSKISSL